MARIIVYDAVTNYITKDLKSAHTPLWEGVPNTLINPTVPNVPISDWIHDNGAIREMTQQEKDTRDASIVADRIANTRQYAKEYFNSEQGKLIQASLLVVLDAINELRAIESLPARTKAQFFNAIIGKIDSGEVD